MSTPTTIRERWREARAKVDAACERAGRAPGDVTIVAVSKTHPAAAVREAAAAGATDFGENYAQELAAKRGELAPEMEPGGLAPTGGVIRWHFIGRLQRNKAKLVAGHVALVHAVDSVELAQELGKRAGGGVQPILLAVNAAGEETKGGVTPEQASVLARSTIRFDRRIALAELEPERAVTVRPAVVDAVVAEVDAATRTFRSSSRANSACSCKRRAICPSPTPCCAGRASSR